MQKIEIREAVTLENNGEKIFGILHRPIDQLEPVPAVVICPGFAGNKCGKFRLFVTLAQELVKLGIAVLRFDYRGSGDSEGEFHDMTIERKISDVVKCLDYLSKDSKINPNRLGLLGRSLGGVIAILTARNFPIKSLVLWAPVFKSDPWRELWESYHHHSHLNITKQDLLSSLPSDIPNLQFLKQFFELNIQAELNHLKHVPLLHIQGELDRIVKIEHAEEYKKVRNGIDNSRFILLPKSDHDFSNRLEQQIAIQETCQWYQQTL